VNGLPQTEGRAVSRLTLADVGATARRKEEKYMLQEGVFPHRRPGEAVREVGWWFPRRLAAVILRLSKSGILYPFRPIPTFTQGIGEKIQNPLAPRETPRPDAQTHTALKLTGTSLSSPGRVTDWKKISQKTYLRHCQNLQST